MGNSQSSNVANIISNVISDVSSQIMSNQSASGNQNQIISVSGGTGDLVISNNIQKQKLTVNMDGLSKALSSQTVQQNIAQKLSQAATSLTKGINLFQNSESDNTMNAFLNVGLNVSSNIGQICQSSGNQNQEINVDTRNGNVLINQNTQDQIAEIITKCIQDATASNSAIQSVQQSVDQQATAKSIGVDLWQIIILAIIGILAMAAPILVPMLGAANIIMKLLFPIIILVGAVFIYLWYTKKTYEMQGIGFSSLIEKDKQCNAQQYNISTEYLTPEDAGAQCMKDSQCQGIDWIPGDTSQTNTSDSDNKNTTINKTSLPITYFYKNLSQTPCPNVKVETTDVQNFTRPAALILQKLASGTTPNQKTGKPNDVFIDESTGRYYWKRNGQWMDQGIIPKFTSSDHAILFGNKGPDNTQGNNEDVYIDTTMSDQWKIYKKDSGSWSSDTNLTSKTADDVNVVFPGQSADSPHSTTIPWSGFKIVTRNNSYLVLGVMLIIFGIMGTIFSFLHKSESSTSGSSTSSTSSTSSK